jgi:hypothetical protein
LLLVASGSVLSRTTERFQQITRTAHFGSTAWQGGHVRWDDLFADLEAQLEHNDDAELWAEVADRSRRELAAIALLDRACAHLGVELQLGVAGVGPVRGRLADAAEQWLLVEERPGHAVLVPVRACLWVVGLGRGVEVPPGQSMRRRLGLGSALRSLAQQRLPLHLVLTDGSQVTGTIDRVHADHLDLAEHPADEPRRRGVVLGVRAVCFEAIAIVRPA